MSNLCKSKKATMVLMNSIGVVVTRNITLIEYEKKKPYQSSNTEKLRVKFIPKGKRKPIGYYYDQVAIFEGWQAKDDDFKLHNTLIVGEFNNQTYEAVKSKFCNLIVEHIC